MLGIKNALGVGAHFDDVELGCGGTLARIVAEGGNAYKITLTNNVTNFSAMGINVDFESSLLDSANACKELGVTAVFDVPLQEWHNLQYSTALM